MVMKSGFEPIRAWATSLIPKTRVRWRLVAALAPLVLLRFYSVRVLVVSEFFFALVFAVVFTIGAAAYVVGAVAASWLERSRPNVEKGYAVLEEGRVE